ncbi:MAG: hypothetical protein M3419_05420, partial [Actinomycetota bacterium]|nr:hypothetical protein [Actinomycetota bacterium]
MSSERPEDVDEAFARLVAGFHDPPDATGRDAVPGAPDAPRSHPWPAAEDLDDTSSDIAAEPEASERPDAAGSPDPPVPPGDELVPAGPGTD